MKRLAFLLLSLPALAQASFHPGIQVTQYGPEGFTALGLQAILAPHPFNALRLRAETSIASSVPSSDGIEYRDAKETVVAADYLHYRHGVDQPGFFIGCGIGRKSWTYQRWSTLGPGLAGSESSGEAHFILGGQFNAHVALEGRIELSSGTEIPAPFAAVALSIHL